MYELKDSHTPYWFNNDEVARIQEHNYPFFKADDMDCMVKACLLLPKDTTEGKWMLMGEIFETLHEHYPMLMAGHQTKIRIGLALGFLGCETKRTSKGRAYRLCVR